VWYGIALDTQKRIVISYFSVHDRCKVISNIIAYLPTASEFIEIQNDNYSFNILKVMSHIYEGNVITYNFRLAVKNLPQFTRKVLSVTSQIPRGFVATYGGIAKAVGNRRAARAVGNVEARNPFAPIIPCHRVVKTTLYLGGYGGGVEMKRQFLEREDVTFDGDRVSRQCLWTSNEEESKIL
jgi:O-6-methylguanine DNA methyltransferase